MKLAKRLGKGIRECQRDVDAWEFAVFMEDYFSDPADWMGGGGGGFGGIGSPRPPQTEEDMKQNVRTALAKGWGKR